MQNIAVWLVLAASMAVGTGRTMIDLARWDAMPIDAKRAFVVEEAVRWQEAGYRGRTTIWSADGGRVLATCDPGGRVNILRGWYVSGSSAGQLAAMPSRGKSADEAIVLVILAVAALLIVFLVHVAIIRWVWRVNCMVERQTQITGQLERIITILEHKGSVGKGYWPDDATE